MIAAVIAQPEARLPYSYWRLINADLSPQGGEALSLCLRFIIVSAGTRGDNQTMYVTVLQGTVLLPKFVSKTLCGTPCRLGEHAGFLYRTYETEKCKLYP